MRPAPLFSMLLLLGVRPAAAHAILVDSTPAPQATVHARHVDVSLRYNSRIDAARSKLTLIRTDRSAARLPIAATDRPDLLRTSLDLPPGKYVIRWQVLAIDGHITRGDLPFIVGADATAL